jgi:hypothetical protein
MNRVRELLMQAMKELKEKSGRLKKNAPVCRVKLKACGKPLKHGWLFLKGQLAS